MSDERTEAVIERICSAARNYPGLIGPTDMWLLVAEALAEVPDRVTATLDALPGEVQEHLRGVYRGLPPAAYVEPDPPRPDERDRQAVYVAVVRWCEADGPPVEWPPGIEGVRADRDSVRQWPPP